MKPQSHIFSNFPHFTELGYSDREKYESLISGFLPLSDLSFPTLMTWWSSLGGCKISQLNGNLVISYWLPGDEENSGLALIGLRKVDESICEIFDWLKSQDKESKLVLVPEFVISKMRYPEMFKCTAQRDHDEYIISVSNFSSIKKILGYKRVKALRFLVDTNEKDVTLQSIDLDRSENQKHLFSLHKEWQDRAIINAFLKHKEDSFMVTVKNADALGVENICLFINGQIHAFFLYHFPTTTDYVTTSYMGFSFEIPGIFEYALHKYTKWLEGQHIKFVNFDTDMGDPVYRTVNLSLSPAHFFRKYIITPKD